ncbi:helicase [Reyranella soli]|uniref:Helicase n=1 Tax=Reyranella soli TaxID=1230389 RepID=A0A512NNN2_9HYPH|nr:helicase [Reyranella soli]
MEAARENIRLGHRRQILCSPTGSGKTIIGLGLMQAAQAVGSRSGFITDRTALVDQTSAAMDHYGIDHGIMQASHWRCRPSAPIQLISAQTLGRRLGKGGYVEHLLRDLRFVLIDEAHTLYRSTLDWLDSLPPTVAVIGLTATPFTRGLSRYYQAIVNVATTDELVETGMLTKPVIYTAVEIDISDVALNSTGEWDDRGLEREGVKIVGDVVAEYAKRTTQYFGGPVKTIVFSSTVAHGQEICGAFSAVGVHFQSISYFDDDEERRAKIAEFRKPDSRITGLVSCDALAKGFDVPDVRACILCRPLRKSLTTHIQQIGRVMRPADSKTVALVIDHTGNALRFLEDTVDFWANGVDRLDDKAEKDRQARHVTEKQRKEFVCVGCGAVLPPNSRICLACGRERPPRASNTYAVSGTTQIVPTRGARNRSDHPFLKDPQLAYRAFLAFTTHRKRGDEAGARRWAAGIYRGVYGNWPSRSYDGLPHEPALLTPDVERFCKRQMARYAGRRNAA